MSITEGIESPPMAHNISVEPFDKSDVVKLSECDDIEKLRFIAERLWMIIDDIDTADDIAKDNDKVYREIVSSRQKARWALPVTSDGYEIYVETKS